MLAALERLEAKRVQLARDGEGYSPWKGERAVLDDPCQLLDRAENIRVAYDLLDCVLWWRPWRSHATPPPLSERP